MYFTMMREQDKALLEAIQADDRDQVDKLLEKEADPNLQTPLGDTPLLLAIAHNYTSIIHKLLAKGANPNISGPWGETPLLLASQKGLVTIISQLLHYGAMLDASNYWGESALGLAAKGGHLAVIAALNEAGIDLNLKDDAGNTALLIAIQQGHTFVVERLLNYGMDPNEGNDFRKTPLLFATERGALDIVDLLLDKKADPNLSDVSEWTPLLVACLQRSIVVAERFLKYGVTPNTSTSVGITPLWLASFLGVKELAELLLKYNANPNITDAAGNTPLSLAAEGWHLGTVQCLLEGAAELDVKSICMLCANSAYPWVDTSLWEVALARGFPTRWNSQDDLDNIEEVSARIHVKDIRAHIEKEVIQCLPKYWFTVADHSELLTFVPDVLRVLPWVLQPIKEAQALLYRGESLEAKERHGLPYPGVSSRVLQLLWAPRPVSENAHQVLFKGCLFAPRRNQFFPLPKELFELVHQQLLCMTLVERLWDAIKEQREAMRQLDVIYGKEVDNMQNEVTLKLETNQPGDYDSFLRLESKFLQRY